MDDKKLLFFNHKNTQRKNGILLQIRMRARDKQLQVIRMFIVYEKNDSGVQTKKGTFLRYTRRQKVVKESYSY